MSPREHCNCYTKNGSLCCYCASKGVLCVHERPRSGYTPTPIDRARDRIEFKVLSQSRKIAESLALYGFAVITTDARAGELVTVQDSTKIVLQHVDDKSPKNG